MDHVWEIKIRTNLEKLWDDIEIEKYTPYCSLRMISLLCHGILFEYPNVISIKIINRDIPSDEYILNQRYSQ